MSAENHKILEKSMRLLESVANHAEGISLTALCNEVDIPKGSAHSLLNTLVNMNYLRRDPRTLLYYLNLRTFEIGARYIENNTYFRYTRDVLERLVAATGQSAHMAVLDGTDVMYIHKVDCSHAIRMVSIVGRRIPAHATAIGKALLADLSDDQIRELYRDRPLSRMTSNTIDNLDALLAQLARTRVLGYAQEREESTIGLECVGVAVGRPGTANHTAISLSVPVDPARRSMEAYIKPILEARQTLQAML